jgi:type 1 glutamine amidotransferase
LAVLRVLLVSAGLFHPPRRGRALVKETLAELPDFAFDEVASLEAAVARGLERYAALVLYFHHRDGALSARELQTFRAWVDGGGGVLALHSATASYKRTPAYFEILGGRFTGHGPVEPIRIRPSTPDDDVFGGIGAFEVTDELYVHELQPDLRVRFETTFRGTAQPMVWTREPRAGRVCYACPGHRSASMAAPAVQEILRRGLRWVSRVT